MATTNVIVSRSGTNFTVDVTACNLLSDLTIKDFVVLHNGSFIPNTNYTKTTSTVITYTGTSLASTTVEIRRKTPTAVIQPVTYGQKFASSTWNNELDRKTRWQEEVDLNGAVAGGVGGNVPKDDAYPTGWSGDTIYSPTRNAAFNIINTLAPLVSPTFTGAVSVPNTVQGATGSTAVNSDRVNAEVALKANIASPAFTGTPTAPTPTPSDNTTKLATTAFVKSLVKLSATRTTQQTVSTGSFQTVLFNAVDRDIDSAYNTGTGTYTVPSGQAGLYFIGTTISFGLVGGTLPTDVTFGINAIYNGSNLFRLNTTKTAGGFFSASGFCVLNLAAADAIRIAAIVAPTGGSGYTSYISPVATSAELLSQLVILKLT